MEDRETNSINFNSPPQSNQDSSLRLTSAPLSSSPTSNHKTYETPDLDPPQTVSRANPQPRPPPSAAVDVVVRYRECQKNHGASMGAHVVDGCGEFMPNGEEGTIEALKCAACECHRNFHRREVESELHHRRTPPVMMAFGGESSSEDLDIFRRNGEWRMTGRAPRKRYRTKFTQEQKEKMHDYADKIGWKMHKQDEQQVVQFCNEIGLKKQVFKVWMHNNKRAINKGTNVRDSD